MAAAAPFSASAASGAHIVRGRAAASTFKAWRAGKTANVYIELGTNKPEDVAAELDPAINPNFVVGGGNVNKTNAPWSAAPAGSANALWAITDAWSGVYYDRFRGEWDFGGGGHATRVGNDWYRMPGNVDAPAWARLIYPSGSIQRPTSDFQRAGFATHAEGFPLSAHVYNLCVPVPSGERVILPGCFPNNQRATDLGFVLSRSGNDWNLSQTFNSIAALATTSTGGGCYDDFNDCIWQFQGRKAVRWDRVGGFKTENGGAITGAAMYTANSGSEFGPYNRPVYDSGRKRISILNQATNVNGQGASSFVYWFNPASPASGIANWNINDFGGRGTHGFDYDSIRGVYYHWNGGATVNVLTPDAAAPLTAPFTITTIAGNTSIVSPGATVGYGGVFGNFGHAAVHDCLFMMPPGDRKLIILPLS